MHHPRRPKHPATNTQQHTPKNPKPHKASMLENRATSRRANQQTKRDNPEALAEPRTNLVARIGAQVHDDGGRETDKRPGEEAVAGD